MALSGAGMAGCNGTDECPAAAAWFNSCGMEAASKLPGTGGSPPGTVDHPGVHTVTIDDRRCKVYASCCDPRVCYPGGGMCGNASEAHLPAASEASSLPSPPLLKAGRAFLSSNDAAFVELREDSGANLTIDTLASEPPPTVAVVVVVVVVLCLAAAVAAWAFLRRQHRMRQVRRPRQGKPCVDDAWDVAAVRLREILSRWCCVR